MMFSLLYTFCLPFYLINIHVFDYPDSRLSGLFTEVPTSPDNRGSTVIKPKGRSVKYLFFGKTYKRQLLKFGDLTHFNLDAIR